MTWQPVPNMISTVEMLLLLCTFAHMSSLIHRPSPNILVFLSSLTVHASDKKLHGQELGTRLPVRASCFTSIILLLTANRYTTQMMAIELT